MKDLVGREVQVGNYICYSITEPKHNSKILVCKVVEVNENSIKAINLPESFDYTDVIYKPERIFILDGFNPELFNV